MGFLEAFNHVSRHSLRTSDICTIKSGRDFSMVALGIFGGPFIGAVFQHNFKMAVAGVAVTGGYIGAKYIHKALSEGRPLNTLLQKISQIDMPLFLGGNLYMSSIYINDFVSTFTNKAVTNSLAEPTLMICSLWASYAAWPKLKPFTFAAPPKDKPLALPPPKV